jgi:hypothetical protein
MKMKIIKNTLEVVIERWDDPGDYPSGAGSGPLPSYDYLDGVDGEVRVELTEQEANELLALQEDGEDLEEWIEQVEIDLPSGVTSVKWHVELIAGNPAVAVLTATEAEGDPDSGSEPDYDDYDDYDD